MTDWGIPDWRDAAAYGDTSMWSQGRWRWEFLRRREDLRRDYELFKQEAFETRLRMAETLGTPDDRPLPDHLGFTTAPLGGEPYGYTGIPCPKFSEQPDALLEAISIMSPLKAFYPGSQYSSLTIDGEADLVIVFDLDRHIGEQLKAAEDLLSKYQVGRHGGLLLNRKHKGKWLRYLRVLDARSDKISWSEIARALLLPTQSTPQAAKGVWDQARALQFKI